MGRFRLLLAAKNKKAGSQGTLDPSKASGYSEGQTWLVTGFSKNRATVQLVVVSGKIGVHFFIKDKETQTVVVDFIPILKCIDEDHTPLEAAQKFGVLQETVAGATLYRQRSLFIASFQKVWIDKRTVKRILGARATLTAMGKIGVTLSLIQERSFLFAEQLLSNVYNADERELPSQIIRRGRYGVDDGSNASGTEDAIKYDEKFDKSISGYQLYLLLIAVILPYLNVHCCVKFTACINA
eukprot:IDg6195t1